MRVFTLRDVKRRINTYIKDALAPHRDKTFPVSGRISELYDGRDKNGYFYFTLYDNTDRMRCIVPPHTEIPPVGEGDLVTISASINPHLHRRYNDIQVELKVHKIELHTGGGIPAMLERIAEKLKKQELYRRWRLERLPASPRRIAVVMPTDSVAQDDIEMALGEFAPYVSLDPITYEVDDAQSVMVQLSVLDASGYDIVVFARGGGVGVGVFDDEKLCYKIAAMDTPSISAVGHSRNIALLDKVATESVTTPTAAGERIKELWLEARSKEQTSLIRVLKIAVGFLLFAILMVVVFFLLNK